MKFKLMIIICIISLSCNAQQNEFGKKNPNNYIYPDSTIEKLKYIVDSLNLKYKICNFNTRYLSKYQGKGHYVKIVKSKINEVLNDLESNIDYQVFKEKYAEAKFDENLLIVNTKNIDEDNKMYQEFFSPDLGGHNYKILIEDEGDSSKYQNNSWIYTYHKKTSWSEEYIEAYYISENFKQIAMPSAYANMIQYSECLIDTNTQVFFDKAVRTGVRYRNEENSSIIKFIDYVHKCSNYPVYNQNSYNEYYRNLMIWDSLKIKNVDSINKLNNKFNNLLEEAYKEAKKNGGGNDEFETYVGYFISKKAELELKRNRRVVGGCSMDNSPRLHSMNIARLSAETVDWSVFLRAHLDIMNDRFERMSDGSYAWNQRKTYIRELEVLDINVTDLLLGICFRIDNPSSNHYYGNIQRIGRALSETSNLQEIETKMLEMIADNELDIYNRIIMYYLFSNYNYHLEDLQKKNENKSKLLIAVKKMPEYISSKIKIDKE